MDKGDASASPLFFATKRVMYYSNKPRLVKNGARYRWEDSFMKTLFFGLILTLVFGAGAVAVQAQRAQQQLTVRVNRQAKHARSNLTIKFVAVEDSRCPSDANCVWAGNAKVTIQVTGRRGQSKTFDLNTNLEGKSARFDGYEITLGTVTPYPASNVRINRNGYTASFTIRKL